MTPCDMIKEMHREVAVVCALSHVTACDIPRHSDHGGMIPPVEFTEPQGVSVTISLDGEAPLTPRAVKEIIDQINAKAAR